VDVVLIGTIVEADSQQSSSSASLPSFGGISLGGSKQNVKATVTLQADLYNTSNGQKIDSISQTGNASQSKVGSDVSTGLGSINTGGADFDNSAMGKAFHAAVSALVKQVNSEQGQMTHFTQGGSPTAAAAAPAPGAALDASANQAGPAAPGSGATPSAAPAADSTAITAYQNYDFTPGDTILFADDFSTTQEGEFPDRWELVNGQGVVNNTKAGLPSSSPTAATAAMPALPRASRTRATSALLTPSNSICIPFPAPTHNALLRVAGSGEGYLNFSHDGLEYHTAPTTKLSSAELPASMASRATFSNLASHRRRLQKTQMKVYVDQYRVLSFPTCILFPFRCNGAAWPVRIIRSSSPTSASPGGGMNMIGQTFTDAKIVTHGINFDVDKATIRPESMGTLNQIKRILTQNPGLKFEIDGHTDNSGTAAHNVTLSQQRADAVKAQLVQMGIDASRLTTKGFGDTKPIADNSTPDGKANNRRVEFVRIN
jgi:OOP family OmpA-OmpF porin